MAELALMLHSGQNWSKVNLKKFDHCVLEEIRQEFSVENFTSIASKMAKLAVLMLHSGQNSSKVNLAQFENLVLAVGLN